MSAVPRDHWPAAVLVRPTLHGHHLSIHLLHFSDDSMYQPSTKARTHDFERQETLPQARNFRCGVSGARYQPISSKEPSIAMICYSTDCQADQG